MRPTGIAGAFRPAPAALVACGLLAAGLRLVAPAAASPPPRAILPGAGQLATSLETTAGTWASLPMGHLGQRLDTFWQLFFRPRGATRWTDEDAYLGVATNGGLVLGRSGASSLLVGIEPSNLLRFSPVARTVGTGRSWSSGAPVPGAAEALAGDGASALALSAGSGGGRALTASRPAASWRPLVTGLALGRTPAGRSCHVVALTAAAYGGSGEPLVGAACDRPGIVGLFEDNRGTWRRVGPVTAPGDRGEKVSVLRLQAGGTGVVALLRLEGPSGVDLAVARSPQPGGRWSVSAPLRLAPGDRLVSAGTAGAFGQLVLLRAPSGAERLLVGSSRGATWSALPPPPRTTATVAVRTSGAVDALAASGSVMTDWTLRSASARWDRTEVVHVGLLYGSSG